MWGSLLQSVIDMSLTASVAIVVVLAARLLLRKAPKIFSYALWAIVLFRLCCPVAITSELSLFGVLEKFASEINMERDDGAAQDYQENLSSGKQDDKLVSEADGEAASTAVQPNAEVKSGDAEQLDSAAQSEPAMQSGVTAQSVLNGPMDNLGSGWITGENGLTVGAGTTGKNSLQIGKTLPEAAAYIWGAGVLAMCMYSLISLLRVRRSLMGAVPLRDNIYVCDYIQSPFVMGVFRPRIYLCSALGESEMEYIILHEQHHIRRCDHLIKIAAFAALCIHWFNPLVWVAFILAGKDMEMSCDEAVVAKLGDGIRWEYSQSLLSLSTGHRMISGAPLAFGEGSTKGRICNLLKKKKAGKWLVGLAVVVLLAAGVILLTDPAGSSQSDSAADDEKMNQVLGETQDMTGESAAESTETETAETVRKITRLECTHEPGTIYGALDAYFSEREKVVNGEASELALDSEFGARIREWSDKMSLDIQEAGVSYEVADVWYNSESTVKLMVYEGVAANYIRRGYTKVEFFGFGWKHVIELSNTGDGWQVTKDSSYAEDPWLNGEVGSEEDVSRIIGPEIKWTFNSEHIPDDFSTPTDEFKAAVQAEIDRQASALLTNKEDWFADYNGEKIQRIASANQELNRPATSSDIIFYRADEGESLEEILEKMVDALMEPFMEASDGQTLSMTEYQLDLENMEILDKTAVDAQIIDELWMAWQCDQYDYEWTFEEYLPKRIYYLDGLEPLGEDMWLIPSLQGSYQYEGRETLDMEVSISADGSHIFYHYGYNASYKYILVKEGMVYRLQRAVDMGYDWEWNGAYWKDAPTGDFSDFVQLIDDALSEEKNRDAAKWRNRELSEWYEEYNGDRLQIIDKGYKGSNVQGFQGIVYYRASEDENVEDVVIKMLNAVMDTLMTESDDRTFVVTDYYIPEQELQSWDLAVSAAAAECWVDYGESSGDLDTMKTYIDEWMSDNILSLRNIRAVPDDMWYFIPSGYYRFEGFDLGTFHEAEAEQSGSAEGMVGFWNQGSDEGAWMFSLMKYGNVYRLQKMSET